MDNCRHLTGWNVTTGSLSKLLFQVTELPALGKKSSLCFVNWLSPSLYLVYVCSLGIIVSFKHTFCVLFLVSDSAFFYAPWIGFLVIRLVFFRTSFRCCKWTTFNVYRLFVNCILVCVLTFYVNTCWNRIGLNCKFGCKLVWITGVNWFELQV